MSQANFNKAMQALAEAFDDSNDMLKVSSMQKKFRDNFSSATLDELKWDSSIGTGTSMTQSSSVLNMVSGVTANAVLSITSKETFTIPIKVSIGLTLSQRIANQTFYVELISVDPVTGLPDGKHGCGILFDGTTATQAKYYVKNGGLADLVSAGVTVVTTASNGMYEIEPFADECWFHSRTLDATTARTNSYVRHQQLPDPNAMYKLRLRWVNGSSAPASTTTAAIRFLAAQDYAELTAEITAGRGQSVAGQAIAAAVTTMPSVVVSASTPATPTQSIINSAATTNATSVKATAGNVYGVVASNTSASIRYLKFYNKASAPTVGTDVPIITCVLPAGSTQHFNFGALGIRFTIGIALAITAGAADSDTAVIAASEVKVLTAYI